MPKVIDWRLVYGDLSRITKTNAKAWLDLSKEDQLTVRQAIVEAGIDGVSSNSRIIKTRIVGKNLTMAANKALGTNTSKGTGKQGRPRKDAKLPSVSIPSQAALNRLSHAQLDEVAKDAQNQLMKLAKRIAKAKENSKAQEAAAIEAQIASLQKKLESLNG